MKNFFLASLVIAAAIVIATAGRHRGGSNERKWQRGGNGTVSFEQNSTCTRTNSRRRATPTTVTAQKTCRCIDTNWQRCVTMASNITAPLSGPNTTLTNSIPTGIPTSPLILTSVSPGRR